MEMCPLTHMTTHCPSETKKLNQLPMPSGQSLTEATSHHYAQALEPCPPSRDDPVVPCRPQQLLLLKLSSTISFSLHQQPTAAFSHLTGMGGEFPTFFLKKWHQLCPFSSGSTHIPQLHSKAAHSATSRPLLAANPGQGCDHSCSTWSVAGGSENDPKQLHDSR